MIGSRPIVCGLLPMVWAAVACSAADAGRETPSPAVVLTAADLLEWVRLPADPVQAAAVRARTAELESMRIRDYYQVILEHTTNAAFTVNGTTFSHARDHWVLLRSRILALDASYTSLRDMWTKTHAVALEPTAANIERALNDLSARPRRAALALTDSSSGTYTYSDGSYAYSHTGSGCKPPQPQTQHWPSSEPGPVPGATARLAGPQPVRTSQLAKDLAALKAKTGKLPEQPPSWFITNTINAGGEYLAFPEAGAAYNVIPNIAPDEWDRSMPIDIPIPKVNPAKSSDWNDYKYNWPRDYKWTYGPNFPGGDC